MYDFRKFHLINPTVDDYYFSWTNRSPLGPGEISNFHCAVTEGIAERGKRTDLAFTFLAENVGVFESFWLFSIDRYNLECLFLLVGIVTEPSVYCLTIHVKLKPTILGWTRSILTVNHPTCFSFSFLFSHSEHSCIQGVAFHSFLPLVCTTSRRILFCSQDST